MLLCCGLHNFLLSSRFLALSHHITTVALVTDVVASTILVVRVIGVDGFIATLAFVIGGVVFMTIVDLVTVYRCRSCHTVCSSLRF